MTDKVVGLDGRPIAPVEIKTDPVIIELLEGALIAAKQGHMSGLAIVTLMGDTTTCHTAFQCDLHIHPALLGIVSVLRARIEKHILEA